MMRQVRNTSHKGVEHRRRAYAVARRRGDTSACYVVAGRRCSTQPNRLLFGQLRLFSSMPDLDKTTLHNWLHHWQDEYDAAFLYLVLAGQEGDPKKKEIYIKLAGVEERHTQMWEKLLAEHGHPIPKQGTRPSLNARLRAWFGRRFGPGYLLPLLLREEGQEVKGYMDLHNESQLDDARDISLKLAKESAAHAETLADLAGKAAEPWHRTESGGYLRNVVYGFNDGLTANFGLVAGVLGAAAAPHIVLVSGIAGMIADALSMGASGYLAAKSEQEVYALEIAMEQEELKIGEAHATPLKEGWVTGVSTAVGALIPVAPFLVFSGPAAAWIAFAVAMLSHLAVGGARSVFTGRGVIRSGIDMFVVGLGVAAVGYVVGDLVAKIF